MGKRLEGERGYSTYFAIFREFNPFMLTGVFLLSGYNKTSSSVLVLVLPAQNRIISSVPPHHAVRQARSVPKLTCT